MGWDHNVKRARLCEIGRARTRWQAEWRYIWPGLLQTQKGCAEVVVCTTQRKEEHKQNKISWVTHVHNERKGGDVLVGVWGTAAAHMPGQRSPQSLSSSTLLNCCCFTLPYYRCCRRCC